MLRTKLLTGLLLVAGLQLLHAQDAEQPKKEKKKEGFFTLRVAGGYGWSGITKPGTMMGPKIDPYSPDKDGLIPMININDRDSTTSNVYGSYGQGMNFTLGLGYMINNYIGVELGISYLKSGVVSCDQTRPLTIQTGFGNPPSFSNVGYFLNANIKTSAFGVSLMPSLIIRGAKPGWKVYPYGRLGISMPVYGKLEHDVTITVDDEVYTPANLPLAKTVYKGPYFLGQQTKVKLETEGTVSLGANAALGVSYTPTPLVTISAEINGQYLVTRAKSAKITQWDAVNPEDGQVYSRLADRGVYRTEFNFVDGLTSRSNNDQYNPNTDKTKAKDDLRPTGQFSNIGFNISVCINLSKGILNTYKKK